MQNVLLVIHLLACIALIVVILLQRSEGGALGIGGGDGLLAGRGAANSLARATMVLGITFFCTSLGLTTLHAISARVPTDVERVLIDEIANKPPIDLPVIPAIEGSEGGEPDSANPEPAPLP